MHESPVDHSIDALDGSPTPKERLQTLCAGIALTLLTLALAVCNPSVVERLNNAFTDIQIGQLPKANLSALPVIVEVDELSLATYGQWPWPRYQVARLLSAIQQAAPVAIGIDALFIEKDRTSPIEIQRKVEQDLHQQLPLTSFKESLRDYDALLGKTLQTGRFVLSHLFVFDEARVTNPCLPKSASGAWFLAGGKIAEPPKIYQATGITCNVSEIQNATKSGFINTTSESDGIYRKTPLIMVYKNQLYPSLALQTYLTAQKIDQFLLSRDETGLTLRLGKALIPLDNTGNLRIKFPAQGQHFKKISAHDLMTGKLAPDNLQGKIVFVGVSATGLHEIRPTPNDPRFLGVEFHAAIVDNLARQDFLQRPDTAPALELAASAVIGLGLFALLANTGIVVSIAVPCLLIAGLIAASQLLLNRTGIIISPALPVIMASLSFLALISIKYAREFLHAKAMALQVARGQEGIIGSFCSMSEYRDPETGAHIVRTQEYVKALAKHLQQHPKFKKSLTNDTIDLLHKAAPLHDIGKIGIRDHILLKKGRLNDSEFATMQAHPQIGAEMIASVAAQIGWSPFMKVAHQISLYHQEKWDGSGYPHGLSGEAIPFPARFMAIADVYDALISKRVYKPPFSHKKAIRLIKAGKSNHFDPLLVEAFEAIHTQFQEIALRFLDNEEQRDILLSDEDDFGY